MSEALANHSEGASPPAARPRFSWPMRLFLGFIVFDMVFHSLAVLTPYRDWCKELDIETFPEELPTVKEMTDLADDPNNDHPSPATDRLMDSFDSAWTFFRPWPSSKTRRKLHTWNEGGKFVICWLTTRLGFLEQVVGFEQKWTMFSPSVGKGDTLVRARLVYADGSVRLVRTEADPQDLTHYSHWFKEKVLEYSTKLVEDNDARLGFCNLLANRYPLSDHGAELLRIYLIKVYIPYPDPDEEDVAKFMRQYNGPPRWENKKPFWVYDDLGKRQGHKINKR
jgi:hypothetical protein